MPLCILYVQNTCRVQQSAPYKRCAYLLHLLLCFPYSCAPPAPFAFAAPVLPAAPADVPFAFAVPVLSSAPADAPVPAASPDPAALPAVTSGSCASSAFALVVYYDDASFAARFAITAFALVTYSSAEVLLSSDEPFFAARYS